MSDFPTHRLLNSLHIVRNLIEGHLSNLEEGIYRDEGEKFRNSQAVLERALVKIKEIVGVAQRLKDLWRVREEVKKSPETVPLREILPRVLEGIKKDFPLDGKNIEILDRIPEGMPPLVVDREELDEILFILVENALQAMKGGGKLILRASFSAVEGKDPCLTVKVIDTGPGIPRNHLASLFEPFFSTKEDSEGNGLGLYIAKELVEKNGGRISVETFEGHGTTFSIQFPLLPSLA